jgi:hypothetical protein
VERNTADRIVIPQQGRRCRIRRIIMMETVVGARRVSRRKTTALEAIQGIAQRDGK